MSGSGADVGVVGLGRLGQRLVAGLVDNGYAVATHNRSVVTAEALTRIFESRRPARRAESIAGLVELLAPPRKVLLAVTSGDAVDGVIEQLVPFLEPGDVIVDASNSHFADTSRRARHLESSGVWFLGAGISGGGGAVPCGPAITVGGSRDAWPLVKDVLDSLAGRSADGEPSCGWVGEAGSGHFVKMIHNGVEYADMQLVCDAYHLLRDGLRLPPAELQSVFAGWSSGALDSYLMAITADILATSDEDGTPIVERILDVADQQGTGAWVVQESLDLGVPATLVAAAVQARSISALKEDRLAAAPLLAGPSEHDGSLGPFVDDLCMAMVASRVVSYTQAVMLLRAGAERHGWTLNVGAIIAIWQSGSIIRSALLDDVRDALTENPDLPSVILDDRFRALVEGCQTSWRRVVTTAAGLGLPTPVISSALTFYDSYRASRLPASLLQAQRDYFAGHMYERVDRERGLRFHTDWTARSTSDPG